jgi:DNA-binding NarL/FixJ family response regulator
VLIRRALSTFLVSAGVACVVVEGDNVHECRDEIRRSRPEMLIVDLHGQGLESMPDFRRLGIVAKIVVLADDLDSASYPRAFQLGIWRCLSTKQSPMAFQNALKCVARGERWMPRQPVTKSLVAMCGRGPMIRGGLTPKEWNVLDLMAKGLHNKEISTQLHIPEETTRLHIKSIYRKLKVEGRRGTISRYFKFIGPREQKTAPGVNPEEMPSRFVPPKCTAGKSESP